MPKKNFKVKISEKNYYPKEKNLSAFATMAITQQDEMIHKKSNLAIPSDENVARAKEFVEENKK